VAANVRNQTTRAAWHERNKKRNRRTSKDSMGSRVGEKKKLAYNVLREKGRIQNLKGKKVSSSFSNRLGKRMRRSKGKARFSTTLIKKERRKAEMLTVNQNWEVGHSRKIGRLERGQGGS